MFLFLFFKHALFNFHHFVNIPVFLLLLTSHFILLRSEKRLHNIIIWMLTILLNLFRLHLWPSIVWKMSNVHLWRMCVLVLLRWAFCVCLLDLFGLLCSLNPLFHYLYSDCFIHYCELGIDVYHYFCGNVYFTLPFCPFLLSIFWWSLTSYVNVYNYYMLLYILAVLKV